MSKNFTVVREMSGNCPKVGNVRENPVRKSCPLLIYMRDYGSVYRPLQAFYHLFNRLTATCRIYPAPA